MILPSPKEKALAHLRTMLGEQADFRLRASATMRSIGLPKNDFAHEL